MHGDRGRDRKNAIVRQPKLAEEVLRLQTARNGELILPMGKAHLGRTLILLFDTESFKRLVSVASPRISPSLLEESTA